MNAKKWITYFENNRSGWTEPDWSAKPEPKNTEQLNLLADSLATFQLGESGGGTRLKSFVEQSCDGSPDYRRAVELFVREEQRHAQILADTVGYLGGDLKEKHWMNTIFRKFRVLVGLQFNLQVLLTAELIAEAYYGLLARQVDDPIIESVCTKIVRDEVKHIQFHEEFFRLSQRRWLPFSSQLWAFQFQVIFMITRRVVWLDHGKCLRAIGVSRVEFRDRANGVCRRFLNRVLKAPSEVRPSGATYSVPK